MYLGDGRLSVEHGDVHSLRVSCDATYPRIIAEAAATVHVVRPGGRVSVVTRTGWVDVVASDHELDRETGERCPAPL